MPTRRRDLAAELRAALGQLRIETVGEHEWRLLQRTLAPVADHRLRELLRATGLPLAPMVEGVRVSSFEELARTLLAILAEYESADVERQRACRRAVIAAKDRARLGSRSVRDAARREAMLEMVEWMLVWLENPPVFRQWIALRLRAKGEI